jgi:hypothetical protein
MTDKLLAEDISVLFEGIEVTEEQKEKFQITLEAVISEKVSTLKKELEEVKEVAIKEAVEAKAEELTESIDTYMDYVINEWMEENKLALESSLKVEAMEKFIDGMKDLFKEHYIEIPEEKADALELAESKSFELQEKLNVEMEKVMSLKKELTGIKKDSIVSQMTEGLTETQKEKFSSLVEDIEFADEEVYSKKLKTIKESFFKEEKEEDNEVINEKKKPETSNKMSAYLNAL